MTYTSDRYRSVAGVRAVVGTGTNRSVSSSTPLSSLEQLALVPASAATLQGIPVTASTVKMGLTLQRAQELPSATASLALSDPLFGTHTHSIYPPNLPQSTSSIYPYLPVQPIINRIPFTSDNYAPARTISTSYTHPFSPPPRAVLWSSQ